MRANDNNTKQNSRRCQRGWQSCTGLAMALLLMTTLHAADSSLVLTANPAQIPLCHVNQPVNVLLTLQNSTATVLSKVCIRNLTNGPIQVAIRGVNPADATKNNCSDGMYLAEINPNTSQVRRLAVTLSAIPESTPEIILWADYQTKMAEKTIHASVPLALNLSTSTPPTAENIKLTTSTSFTALQENATGNILLTIENKTNEPLSFTVSKPLAPDFTEITPKDDVTVGIPPQSIATRSFSIQARNKVTPGKYLGVFEVTSNTNCGIPIQHSISYEVTLGVFGQSDILTLLNVPSILLLPGYLMLALWVLLWRFKPLRITWLFKAGSSDEFFVGLRDAEFWLLGITISLLLYFLGMPLLSISNVQAYSLRDIAKLWTLSLTISAVAYLILLGINRWRSHVAKNKLAATTLTRSDDVITALQKINRRNWDLRSRRPVKTITDVTPQLKGFLLWPATEADSSWLIPQIIVSIRDDQIGDLDPAEQNIDGATLLKRLKRIVKIAGAQVKWADIPGFDGPIVVNNSEVEQDSQTDLVRVDYK